MTVRRIKPVKGDNGRKQWSDWITPVMRGYLMACCDCGLVHEIDFKTVEVTKKRKKDWLYRVLPRTKFRVALKARRAERHTAQHRKRTGNPVKEMRK
jgi:hypothetical protein